MHQRKSLETKSATVTGIAASIMLGLAGVTLTPAPAEAVIYCTYVGYPAGCVARAGVVLRPRPVARAAVRGATAGPGNWTAASIALAYEDKRDLRVTSLGAEATS